MSVVVTGIKEIDRALGQLEPKLQKKVVRQALRKSCKVIQSVVKDKAPVESGDTKRAVKVRAGKRSRKGFTYKVQIGEGDYKGDQYYASFIEYGHFQGSRKLGDKRKWVEPQPFMRPAYEATKEQAKDMAIREIKAGIDRVVKESNA